MKKTLFFVASLLLSSMAFAEMQNCTIDITADSLAKVYSWQDGTSHMQVKLDTLISLLMDTTYDAKTGAVAKDQNGVYWIKTETNPGDWRVYQARVDSFWMEAANGALIDSVQLTYGNKNDGTWSTKRGSSLAKEFCLASDAVLNVGGQSKVCLYMGATSAKTNGQMRIQRFRIYYRSVIMPTDNERVAADEQKAVKFIRNGQLYIRQGNREYSILGF